MTRSADEHHYGRLSREDSGGRKGEEESTLLLTLRCIMSEERQVDKMNLQLSVYC